MAFKIINPELISPKNLEQLKKEFVTLSSLSIPILCKFTVWNNKFHWREPDFIQTILLHLWIYKR